DVIIAIKNDGLTAAHAPYLTILLEKSWQRTPYGLSGAGEDGLWRVEDGRGDVLKFHGDATAIIAPGATVEVRKVKPLTRVATTLKLKCELGAQELVVTPQVIDVELTGRPPSVRPGSGPPPGHGHGPLGWMA